MAHSTHLRGQGSWDPEDGELNRVSVTLATGIPEDIVTAVLTTWTPPPSILPHTKRIPTPSSNPTP